MNRETAVIYTLRSPASSCGLSFPEYISKTKSIRSVPLLYHASNDVGIANSCRCSGMLSADLGRANYLLYDIFKKIQLAARGEYLQGTDSFLSTVKILKKTAEPTVRRSQWQRTRMRAGWWPAKRRVH